MILAYTDPKNFASLGQ